MRRSFSLFLLTLLAPQLVCADETLREQAAAIMPRAEELKWQQIPWITDLAAGQQLARDEGRPIFLWVTGDDPLERC